MKPGGTGKAIAGRVPAFPTAALAALAVFAAAAAIALAACVGDDRYSDGPSTEAGNPALAGILRDSQGRPAAGALVKLYRHNPDTFPSIEPMRLDSFRTGADGAYRFEYLEGGTYALEAFDVARRDFSFLPSAAVPSGDSGFRRRDTLVLKRPGRVRGIALRDSNPRPPDVAGEAGILVRFIGLDRATYTDSAGRYAFADIPEGTYSVHFMASDGHYLGETAGPVPVASGAEVELDTVVLDWSPFVDPPAPDGLSVTPDSAAGVIRLRWNPVHLPNFDHYRVLRNDSLSPAAAATFRTRDTAYADTVRHLPAGRVLTYRVQAVNTLGNASRNEVPRPVPVPVTPPVGPEPGNLEVAALVLSGGAPGRALVRLYAISPVPDPTERVPSGITLVDSAQAGADGRVRFAGRAAGLYTLAASASTGTDVAARVGIPSRPGGGAPDTLRLAAPGTLRGEVTRGGLWCTNDLKLNQNIQVSLAGTPWFDYTEGGGGFEIAAVPAGAYRAAIAAVPKGCTLPDTLAAVILPGQAAVLPTLALRPAPDHIPMIADLRANPGAGGKVYLQWTQVPPAYARVRGYEAVRRDSAGAVTASSGLLAVPAWTDDVSGLPSGTKVSYLVRVVRDDGVAGRFGGVRFDPLYFTVP